LSLHVVWMWNITKNTYFFFFCKKKSSTKCKKKKWLDELRTLQDLCNHNKIKWEFHKKGVSWDFLLFVFQLLWFKTYPYATQNGEKTKKWPNLKTYKRTHKIVCKI
jgi:hypothetical protein